MVMLPLCWRLREDSRWHHSLPARDMSIMFWHLLPGPVIGGQAYKISPSTTPAQREKKTLFDEKTGGIWPNAELSERATYTREYFLRQFWQSFVDDRFDLDNAIQTKAEFSCAVAVMDKIGRWEEENWVGSKFAACMWIFSKAVICNGQNNMQNYMLLKFRSIMEAANWVCDVALDDHVWASELTISYQGTIILDFLQYDLANPCIVQ